MARKRQRAKSPLAPPPPPGRFIPAGRVTSAWLSPTAPPFLKNPRRRGARAAGLRYERKALATLSSEHPEFLPRPWFRYTTPGVDVPRWCQPDGLLFDLRRGLIVLIEVKLRHTADAWWQVRHLYEPVVAACFAQGFVCNPAQGDDGLAVRNSASLCSVPLWEIAAVEVVRWYDPDVPFPEPLVVVPDLKDASPKRFSVLVHREN